MHIRLNIVVLAIAFAGCAPVQPEQPSVPSVETPDDAAPIVGAVTYENPEAGFSFVYPEAWGHLAVTEVTGATGKEYYGAWDNDYQFAVFTNDYSDAGRGLSAAEAMAWKEIQQPPADEEIPVEGGVAKQWKARPLGYGEEGAQHVFTAPSGNPAFNDVGVAGPRSDAPERDIEEFAAFIRSWKALR